MAAAQEVRIGSQTFISNFYSAAPQAEIAKPTGPIPPCPYPGLAYFGPSDAARFFGREQAIHALVAAVAKRSFTALVGASGSGKSSVVLAGLAPRLETEGGWRATYFRIGTEPDKNPFAALARALAPLLGDGDVVDRMTRAQKLANSLANSDISLVYGVGQCRAANPGKRILLIADQFEEVFTLVPDETLRDRFIDALIAAFPDPGQGATPDVSLVLTLRADFVSQAINYRPLADKLKNRVEYLGPMTRDELREAIVEPAKAVAVEFEPGLVNTILDDVEKRPGSLPLLQFALREMWGRLKTPLMTRPDYDAIGGVEGALAKRAQAILDAVTDQGRNEATVALFRRLFTRLVTLGEGSEDTRRIVGREELGSEAWALAQKLADEDNRLVVTAAASGKETAEVVHETLIRNWPTLVEWVNLDRAFQTWLRQLKPRMDDWRANPSDAGTLLRGGPLVVAENWIVQRGGELNDEEKAYVVSSIELRKAERQREKEDLEQKQAGRTAMARERVAGAFVELRGQLWFFIAVAWLVLSSGQLFKSYLFASEHDWSTLTYTAYRSGQLSNSFLFVGQYDWYHFIYAVSTSVILGLAVFMPILRHYIGIELLMNTRDFLHTVWLKGPRVPIFELERPNSRSFIKYFRLVLYSISIIVMIGIILRIIILRMLFLTYVETSLDQTPWLEAVMYALSLTLLIDTQIAGVKIQRACEGVTVGIMVGICQALQSTYLGTHLAVFSAVIALVSFGSGFVVGWYLPVNVAAALIHAESVLDQCSAEIFTSEPQYASLGASA